MTKDLSLFEASIGIHFDQKDLLKQAFTHRSYLNENKHAGLFHNERLEFLGDAVLEMVITEFLFHKYPDSPEGVLTSYRAALVNTITLSDASLNLGINDFLLLSRGESKDVGRARRVILANTFEAVVGAIYLDKGYETCRTFISHNLFPKIDEIIQKKLWKDPKSRLQEIAQEKLGVTPIYNTLKEEGPDHQRLFKIGVLLGDQIAGEGMGYSKQEAAQEAAQDALQTRGW